MQHKRVLGWSQFTRCIPLSKRKAKINKKSGRSFCVSKTICVRQVYLTNKSWRQIRVWKGGPWSRIPAPFPRQSRIPNFCHLYPEYGFLSQIRLRFQDFGESRFPCNSQIPYPVKAFCVFQNPALYVTLIPGPENTLPDPKKSGGQCKPAF